MKAAEFRRAYGSKERVEFVRWMPCCICGRQPSENHHTRNGGFGRKGPFTSIVPLCTRCHNAYHTTGRDTLLHKSRPLIVFDFILPTECDTWEEAALAVEKLWQARDLP